MFEGLGDLAKLMKNARHLGQRAEDVKENLKNVTVEGTAADGRVRVVATGDQQVVSIDIDDSVERQVLAEEVLLAVNEALYASKQRAKQEMQQIADDMGMGDLLGRFGGNS